MRMAVSLTVGLVAGIVGFTAVAAFTDAPAARWIVGALVAAAVIATATTASSSVRTAMS